MTNQELRQTVLALASARRDLAQARADVTTVEEEHADVYERLTVFATEVSRLEGKLRTTEYSASNKAPAPGLTVKMVTRLTYNYEDARYWAIADEHYNMVTLDTKAFEKAAAALQLELDFVTIEKVPQVSIARDLTEAAQAISAEMAAEA